MAITKSIWNIPETLLLLHLYPLNLPWNRKPLTKKAHLVFERFQELYGRRTDRKEEENRLDIREKTFGQFRSKIQHLKELNGIYDRNNN